MISRPQRIIHTSTTGHVTTCSAKFAETIYRNNAPRARRRITLLLWHRDLRISSKKLSPRTGRATSSCEAEHVALDTAAKEALFLKIFVNNLGIDSLYISSVKLFINDQSAE